MDPNGAPHQYYITDSNDCWIGGLADGMQAKELRSAFVLPNDISSKDDTVYSMFPKPFSSIIKLWDNTDINCELEKLAYIEEELCEADASHFQARSGGLLVFNSLSLEHGAHGVFIITYRGEIWAAALGAHEHTVNESGAFGYVLKPVFEVLLKR